MSFSVNEVESLATKAARGAGAAPAQAAHFGRATAHHIAAHRPDADVLNALNALPDGPIKTLPIGNHDTSPLGISYTEAHTPLPTGTRLTPTTDLYTQLTALAQRMYVPSSDTSRASGAGAGLTDND